MRICSVPPVRLCGNQPPGGRREIHTALPVITEGESGCVAHLETARRGERLVDIHPGYEAPVGETFSGGCVHKSPLDRTKVTGPSRQGALVDPPEKQHRIPGKGAAAVPYGPGNLGRGQFVACYTAKKTLTNKTVPQAPPFTQSIQMMAVMSKFRSNQISYAITLDNTCQGSPVRHRSEFVPNLCRMMADRVRVSARNGSRRG